MQALHAAETGKLEWDWTAAFCAIGLRIGMAAAESHFPKLFERYSKFSAEQKAEIRKRQADILA